MKFLRTTLLLFCLGALIATAPAGCARSAPAPEAPGSKSTESGTTLPEDSDDEANRDNAGRDPCDPPIPE